MVTNQRSVLPDVVDPVIKTLPQSVLAVGVPHKQTVDDDSHQDLDYNLKNENINYEKNFVTVTRRSFLGSVCLMKKAKVVYATQIPRYRRL